MDSGKDVILIVIGQLDVGGAETHIAQVYSKLYLDGCQFKVFVFTSGGQLEDKIRAANIEIIFPRKNRSRLLRIGFCAFKLLLTHWKHRPAVTHYFLPEAYLLGSLVSIFAPKSVRIMSRRSLNFYQKRRPVLGILERITHKLVFGFTANSYAVARELKEEGVSDSDIQVIYNGVEAFSTNQNELVTVRDELSIPQDIPIMVMVANLIPYKGHRDLIDALSQIEVDLEWHMLIIGEDRGILAELTDFAESKQVSGHISWLGARNDIGRYLKLADIGLLTSHEEGFSNSILEGMIAGVAMIVTDVGGNREAVVHAKTGLVVPPRDSRQLATAISKLLRNRELRESFGREGKRRAEKLFSLDSCLQQYRSLYENLLQSNPQRIGLTVSLNIND